MSQAQNNAAGTSGGSFTSYTIGFILSTILTVIPFALVMTGILPHTYTLFSISLSAILQICVQLYYFLHLDTSSKVHWDLLALLFTIFIIFLFVGGTIWIMYSLHYRM